MGKLIEFYHPAPKSQMSVEEALQVADEAAGPAIPAADILKKCLDGVKDISTVLVMTSDIDGVLGFVTNAEGLAESLLFIELVKTQALLSRVDDGGGGPA